MRSVLNRRTLLSAARKLADVPEFHRSVYIYPDELVEFAGHHHHHHHHILFTNPQLQTINKTKTGSQKILRSILRALCAIRCAFIFRVFVFINVYMPCNMKMLAGTNFVIR